MRELRELEEQKEKSRQAESAWREEFMRDWGDNIAGTRTAIHPVRPLTSPAVPAPHTRSPVTFAGLLLPVREEGSTLKELDEIVKALVAPQPLALGLSSACVGEAGGGHGYLMTKTATITRGMMTMLAGMEVLGHRVPPDGAAWFWAPAGTDERCFRRPPDLVSGCRLLLISEQDPLMNGVGTNKRQFRRPPDPVLEMMQGWRTVVLHLVGTEMQGFRTPPDG